MNKLAILLLLFSASAFAELFAELTWNCPEKREDGTLFDCENDLKEFVVKAATPEPIAGWETLWSGKETITKLKIEEGVSYNFAVFTMDTAGSIPQPALTNGIFRPKTITIPISAPGRIESINVKLIFVEEETQ